MKRFPFVLVLAGSLAAALVPAAAVAGWDPLQKAQRAMAQGEAAWAAGDSLKAIEHYLKAQALAPDDANIRMAVGEAFYENQEYNSALSQFNAVAQGDDGDARAGDALYNAGNAAFRAGDYQTALDIYSQAVAQGSRDEDLLYNLELTQKILENSQSQDESQPGDESQQGENQDEQDQQEQDQQQQQEQQHEQQQQEQDQQQEQQQEEQEQEQQQEQEEQPGEEEQPESEEEEEQPEPETAPPDSSAAQPPPAVADSTMVLPEGMTPQQAMRLLDALDHDEEELRKSIQRRLRGGKTESKHDW